METLRGLTNWRLTLCRGAEGVTILRALSCDRRAVLPDTLFDLPVTALHDRALAAGAKPLEGEEVLILGGAEDGDWDNRGITELSLPRSLRQIGDYAFMNLRAMETLRFTDALEGIGSASFMNCRAFSRLELTRGGLGRGTALASLVQNLPQELDVTVTEADGTTLRLLFPEYIESFTENSPAHHFQLQILGGGYAYHSVFRGKALDLTDYDALWPGYLAAEHDPDSALRLAYYRLRYPAQLGERARALYEEHLRRECGAALSLALELRDSAGLRLVLGLHPESGAIDAALEKARALGSTEATAILLETRHRLSPLRRRRFEL